MGISMAAARRCMGWVIAWVVLAIGTQAQLPSGISDRKPVVVELFTSEGCSSCPPADTLLQQLQTKSPLAGAEVVALEEHVDYWNHDGWIDPYSSAEWTKRQEAYVSFRKTGPYTPELVVDGQSQFVGNNEEQAKLEIQKAAAAAKTAVAIVASRETTGAQHLHVSVGKIDGDVTGDVAEVWLAVTEDGLHSSVSRGENAGHVLQHVATLRSLQKIGVARSNGAAASFTGDSMVNLDSRWIMGNLHIIVF